MHAMLFIWFISLINTKSCHLFDLDIKDCLLIGLNINLQILEDIKKNSVIYNY